MTDVRAKPFDIEKAKRIAEGLAAPVTKDQHLAKKRRHLERFIDMGFDDQVERIRLEIAEIEAQPDPLLRDTLHFQQIADSVETIVQAIGVQPSITQVQDWLRQNALLIIPSEILLQEESDGADTVDATLLLIAEAATVYNDDLQLQRYMEPEDIHQFVAAQQLHDDEQSIAEGKEALWHPELQAEADPDTALAKAVGHARRTAENMEEPANLSVLGVLRDIIHKDVSQSMLEGLGDEA